MHRSLGFKINFLIGLIVAISIGSIGIFLIRSEKVHLKEIHIAAQKSAIRVEADLIKNSISDLMDDATFLSQTPPVRGILRASNADGVDPMDGSTLEIWENRLQSIFLEFLRGKKQYLEASFIGIADSGKELVRAESYNGEARIIGPDRLQRKSKRDYFQDVLQLKPGEKYLSNITLNREFGKVMEPHIAVMRASVPVFDSKGKIFGFIKLNRNFNADIDRLAGKRPGIMITNQSGEYLYHSDITKRFAFEFGKSFKLKDDFPFLKSENISKDKEGVQVRVDKDENFAFVFHPIELNFGNQSRLLGFAEKIDLNTALLSVDSRINEIILLIGVLFLVTLAAGMYFSKRLTTPLKQMSDAIHKFSRMDEKAEAEARFDLPVHENSEIGVLAKSLDTMVKKIKQRIAEIQMQDDQNRFLASIVENTDVAVVGTSLDGTVISWNSGAESTYGYSALDMIGKSLWKTLPESRKNEGDWLLSQVKEGNKVDYFETQRIRKDNKIIDVLLALSPIIDTHGTLQGASAIARDITPMKQAEEKLKTKNLFSNLHKDIAVTTNMKKPLMDAMRMVLERVCKAMEWPVGHVYFVEEGMDNTRELVSSEVWFLEDPVKHEDFKTLSDQLGFQIGIGLPGRAYENKKAAWIENLDSDKNFPRLEVALKSGLKSGFAFPVLFGGEVLAVMEFYSEGYEEPNPFFLDVMSDIGFLLGSLMDRKRIERGILKAKEEAEEANSSKSAFIANMSHEIRTPLNAILGYAQILMRKKDLVRDVREGLQVIDNSGRNLLIIINEILDFSKIEAGQMDLSIVDFDLNSMVDELSKMFEFKCQEKNIAWVAEGIGGDELFLKGDENKLRQVLINLLGNAIKFTNEGSILLKVSPDGEDVFRFDVKDTGCGIPPSARELIFEPFQQHESGAKKGGTGLGLNIAQKQLALMGSELKFESLEGKGTHFFFSVHLPISEEVAKESSAIQGEILALANHMHIKALVVDDVKENRDVLRLSLTQIGVEVCTDQDGESALKSARVFQPDIVFTDMRMPGMDGQTLLEEIRKNDKLKECKVVAITASAFGRHHSEFLKLGFNDFIPKPYRSEDIYSCLKNQLNVEFVYDSSIETRNAEEKHLNPNDFSDLDLPIEYKNKILEAAELYQVTRMERTLEELKEEGEEYAALVDYLTQLASKYDMEAIRNFIQKLPESTPQLSN